jgi:hypothetical protein
MNELYITAEEYCDLYNVKLFADMADSGKIKLSYVPGGKAYTGKYICITGEETDLLILKLKMTRING